MSEELKSCPFCGGAAKTFEPYTIGHFWNTNTGCTDCGALVVGEGFKKTSIDASIAAWNRRAARELTDEEITVVIHKTLDELRAFSRTIIAAQRGEI
jgi:hypothetical protein